MTARRPRNSLLLCSLVTCLCLLGATPWAEAVLTLRLTDGTTALTIGDGSPSDLSSLPGVVQYSGALGNFYLNITTGFNLGTQAYPYLDLFNVNLSSTGGGTLTIMLSETDFVGSEPFLITSQIGGTTGGTVTYESYFDTTNQLFALTSLIATLGPFAGAFGGSVLGWVGPESAYSLTLVTSVTHPGTSSVVATSFNAELKVAQPATLLLLGSGLLGLRVLTGFLGRRSRALR